MAALGSPRSEGITEMKTTRIAALATVLAAGATIGLAGPSANAEWTDGTYRGTVLDTQWPGADRSKTLTMEVTSCGPDCKTAVASVGAPCEPGCAPGPPVQFHWNGQIWQSELSQDRSCPLLRTVDDNSLVYYLMCPNRDTHVQLTKIS